MAAENGLPLDAPIEQRQKRMDDAIIEAMRKITDSPPETFAKAIGQLAVRSYKDGYAHGINDAQLVVERKGVTDSKT